MQILIISISISIMKDFSSSTWIKNKFLLQILECFGYSRRSCKGSVFQCQLCEWQDNILVLLDELVVQIFKSEEALHISD